LSEVSIRSVILISALALFVGCDTGSAPAPDPTLSASLSYEIGSENLTLTASANHSTTLHCTGVLSRTVSGSGMLSITADSTIPITDSTRDLSSECRAEGINGLVTDTVLHVNVPENIPPSIEVISFDSTFYILGSTIALSWRATSGGPGDDHIARCFVGPASDPRSASEGSGNKWSVALTAVRDSQVMEITCSDSRGAVVTRDTIAPVFRRFHDHGLFTRVRALDLDILDLSHFYQLTHQEVLDSVGRMGEGWFLAEMDEVRPLWEFIQQGEYVDSVRHMVGYYELHDKDTIFYNSAGRTADVFDSHPTYRWLWGLGTGIQRYNHQADSVEYHWSSFGIGADYAETRFNRFGAWVIRILSGR
jgi:hypothetical protein